MNEFEQNIKKLVDDGLVVIPNYPSTYYIEEKRGIPSYSWSKINKPIETLDLLDKIKKNGGCEIVELVCGIPSGGLICWDVDTKHKDGFGAIITNDIKTLYPDIWEKLRIDKTPSGGLHIYYRIDSVGYGSEFPSGGNIASRYTTEDERIIKKDKTVCFLELKAKSLLCRSFPSVGYKRVKESCCDGGKLSILSWEDHCCLFSQCQLYNELIKKIHSQIRKAQ